MEPVPSSRRVGPLIESTSSLSPSVVSRQFSRGRLYRLVVVARDTFLNYRAFRRTFQRKRRARRTIKRGEARRRARSYPSREHAVLEGVRYIFRWPNRPSSRAIKSASRPICRRRSRELRATRYFGTFSSPAYVLDGKRGRPSYARSKMPPRLTNRCPRAIPTSCRDIVIIDIFLFRHV